MSEELSLPFIGKIPIDPELMKCEETGKSFWEAFPQSHSLDALSHFVNNTLLSSSSSSSPPTSQQQSQSTTAMQT